MTVLLVEDSEVDVELMRSTVARSDHQPELVVVGSGEAAIELLCHGSDEIDLVLLDMNLPGMRGDEVLHIIRSDDRTRLLPVVVLSSSSADVDVRRAYEAGANAFVRKPIGLADNDQLCAAICGFWCGVVELPSRSG